MGLGTKMFSKNDHFILPSGFSNVDKLKDPHVLVDYLDTINTNPSVRLCKQQVLEALQLQPGDWVIDVGCGIGHITLELAKKIEGVGHIVGIDSSQIMIGEAKERARGLQGLPVEYRWEDAHHLSFPENSFDVGLIMSTLIHVKRPQRVLSELFRVVRPGGRVVVMESDWQLMAFSTGNKVVDKTLASVMRRSVRHSGIGHQLPILMKTVGFADISIAAGTLMTSDYQSANQTWRIQDNLKQCSKTNKLPKGHADGILRALQRADETGLFFGASVGFVVTGKKPISH